MQPSIIEIPKQLQCLVDQIMRLFREYLCSKLKATILKRDSGVFLRIFRNFKDLLQLLWNICGWLLLYIARLLSAWRKVCLYAIYYSFIWFNFVGSIKTKKSFSFFYKFKIKLVLIFNYSLGSLALLVASRVINNTSVCTDCVCDINVTCNLWPRRFAPTIFYHSNTNHQVEMGEHYPFVNHYMEKSLFILYMSFMYSLKLLFF